jgi:hypothetical protein
MTISPRSMAFFADFRSRRALTWIFFAGIVAGIAGAPHTADARGGGIVRAAGPYDGIWNVVFFTQAGNCSPTNSAPFAVSGGRVSSAGGGRVTGGVSRRGAVSVRVSFGQSAASGGGRLVGNSGAGRWSGVISGARCSGSWQARRG